MHTSFLRMASASIFLVAMMSFLPDAAKAQQPLTNQRALEIISSLEGNPVQANSKQMSDSLTYWLDACREVVVYITKEEMDHVQGNPFLYSHEMYVLLLGGMARYDLQHPDVNPEKKEVDKEAGLQCMCNGFHSLVASKGKMKNAGYFKKTCKKFPAQAGAQQAANP